MTERPERAALLELVVSGWRITRVFASALEKLDALERQRYANQLQFFADRVMSCASAGGFRLLNMEGQIYDSGMALNPLNLADFPPDRRLMVVTMLEPVILAEAGVVRYGTAVLGELQA